MKNQNTFAELAIRYNEQLTFEEPLPVGFQVMNPFRENPEGRKTMERFYHKFYNDHNPRKLLLGINPGRFGAGVTGIPFTDTKRLKENCGIPFEGKETYEPSATFVYQMIEAFGGVAAFYNTIYIYSIFPLAIVRLNEKGTYVNCNYYDDKRLVDLLNPFMVQHLKDQIKLGLYTDVVYVLGKRNAKFVAAINKEFKLFDKLEILEHPRYIQQYKSKQATFYVKKFVKILKEN